MLNDNLCKVVDRFEEEAWYDKISLTFAEDHDGRYYVILDGHDDAEKFVSFVRETLEIPEEETFFTDELLECEVVYYDEYTTCDDCGKVIRISPDSYHWQPDFYVGDGFIVCSKCFNQNEEYQENYIEDKINNPKNAINGLISEDQLEQLGFEKFNHNSYENGWHEGQNDNPESIFDDLSDKYEDIIFFVDGVGQFDVSFRVWVRGEI